MEIKLDEQKMDIHRTDNPWLTRAAQSLAEAFRLAASKELDIEFTELVTGYRIRTIMPGRLWMFIYTTVYPAVQDMQSA